MKVLVIGNGGREHALAWKAAQSPKVEPVFVAPGNAGTALEPTLQNVAIGVTDIPALLAFAQWGGMGLPLALRYVAVLLFSAVGGLVPATLFTCAVRLAPNVHTVSTTVGFMQQFSCIGQFMGPPLVAALATAVGGWQWTWAISGLLCTVGVVLAAQVQSLWLKMAA